MLAAVEGHSSKGYKTQKQDDQANEEELCSSKSSSKSLPSNQEVMNMETISVKDDFRSLMTTKLATTTPGHIEEFLQRYMQIRVFAFSPLASTLIPTLQAQLYKVTIFRKSEEPIVFESQRMKDLMDNMMRERCTTAEESSARTSSKMGRKNHQKTRSDLVEVYSNVKIIEVIRVKNVETHGKDFMEETVVKRANEKAYIILESDYKYLNKNDTKDIYLMCLKREVDHTNALLNSLIVFIKGCVIWERVHDYQLRIESYQIKINLTVLTLVIPGIEALEPYTIIIGSFIRIVVLKKIKKILLAANHGFKEPPLSEEHKELMELYEVEIKEHLKAVAKFNLRVLASVSVIFRTKDAQLYLDVFQKYSECCGRSSRPGCNPTFKGITSAARVGRVLSVKRKLHTDYLLELCYRKVFFGLYFTLPIFFLKGNGALQMYRQVINVKAAVEQQPHHQHWNAVATLQRQQQDAKMLFPQVIGAEIWNF
nr:hypothetical protein [Tanacetum cinerariifolium]